MESNDRICITRKQAFLIGFGLLIVAMVIIANLINSRMLSSRSRAAGADLTPLPGNSFEERARSMSAMCEGLKGYLARTGYTSNVKVGFDRFTGRYYSLETVNPVVTPPAGQKMAAYCAVTGVLGDNWCAGITAEPACKADCAWVPKCGICAPKGVDESLICQP